MYSVLEMRCVCVVRAEGGLRVSSLLPAAGKSLSEVMCHNRGGGGGTKWREGIKERHYALYNAHACIGAYESVQHSLSFTIVSSSNLSSQGVVFASSRMGHGSHQ